MIRYDLHRYQQADGSWIVKKVKKEKPNPGYFAEDDPHIAELKRQGAKVIDHPYVVVAPPR